MKEKNYKVSFTFKGTYNEFQEFKKTLPNLTNYKEEEAEYFTNMSFDDFINDYIENQLEDFEGVEVYPEELASLLTENENVNGSLHCNTYKDKKFIEEFPEEAAKTLEYCEDLEIKVNPYKEPEKFACMMVIKGTEEKIGELPTIQKYNSSGEKIELNREMLDTLKAELHGEQVNCEEEER